MVLIHNIKQKDLDILFEIFAKPIPHHQFMDWIAPAWWYALLATSWR